MGPFKIYPNMYIVLIAGSGRMRKSTAIGVTRDILEQLSPPPNLISQKVTPEALLDAMHNTGTQPDKTITIGKTTDCRGYLVTDELTNFLNHTSIDMVPMLTEFYDCRNKFSYQTKSRGLEPVTNSQLGILAATTPEELRKSIPEEVIGAGLASRMLFVYESIPEPPVAFPTYTRRQMEAKEYCIRLLQRTAAFSGEVKLSSECHDWCEVCYKERCWNSPLQEDVHLRGYASRRYIHILKLAMNLSIGLTETLAITTDILTRAEALVAFNEENLQKIVRLVTMNEKGSLINFVYQTIAKHRKISRNDLMSIMSHRIDSRELTEIIETLKQGHQIEVMSNGANIFYVVVR